MTVTIATRSHALLERAKKTIPGGVNSPVRALKSVGKDAIFIDRADAAYLYDVDGEQYIDYVGSWGPMILGHRHPRVLEALEVSLKRGVSFGAATRAEVEMAEVICQLMPSIEMVRMVNSGTEATMSAIRLARAFTKKDLVVKFEGCYHGHSDGLLAKAGSGVATLGISGSPGVPEATSKLTITLPFNDVEAVNKAFEAHAGKIACVIIEPIVGNAGLILPEDGYLEHIREACTKDGALLIFDEVMTGFRVALGGAQQRYKIKPDLTCLGKIIGGGLPVGAYGGSKEIMSMVAPEGDVYQAGTLSGNLLTMAAGLAQLRTLMFPGVYGVLEEKTTQLVKGLEALIEKHGTKAHVVSVPGMLCLFFSKDKVKDLTSAQKCDTEAFSKMWGKLAEKGVYWPPSQFESAFVSLVHSKKDIEETLEAFDYALT